MLQFVSILCTMLCIKECTEFGVTYLGTPGTICGNNIIIYALFAGVIAACSPHPAPPLVIETM